LTLPSSAPETLPPSPKPSAVPSATPSLAPTTLGLAEAISDLADVSDIALLTNPDTPQYAASRWIATEDSYVQFQELESSDPKYIQRFVSALYHYSYYP
jgi:hypothetical protein